MSPPSSVASQDISLIKKQVEFYFSNANYRLDTFLRSECEIGNGGIRISKLLTFRRLREMNADERSVLSAVKDSDVVEIVNGDTIKKRMTDEYKTYIARKNYDDLVIGIRGLSKDMNLNDIESLLNEHMKPQLIRMMRNKSKEFTGDVLVELKSESDVEDALKLKIPLSKPFHLDGDVRKRAKLGGGDLEILTKKEFIKRRMDEVKRKNNESKNSSDDLSKIDRFEDKIFKYETEKDMSIREIKDVVQGLAYVDTNEKVLRFKKAQSFNDKTYKGSEEHGGAVTVRKMTGDEHKAYVEKINIKKRKEKKK